MSGHAEQVFEPKLHINEGVARVPRLKSVWAWELLAWGLWLPLLSLRWRTFT
jgi:hypothetical protein